MLMDTIYSEGTSNWGLVQNSDQLGSLNDYLNLYELSFDDITELAGMIKPDWRPYLGPVID